jgi:hypothetical protein
VQHSSLQRPRAHGSWGLRAWLESSVSASELVGAQLSHYIAQKQHKETGFAYGKVAPARPRAHQPSAAPPSPALRHRARTPTRARRTQVTEEDVRSLTPGDLATALVGLEARLARALGEAVAALNAPPPDWRRPPGVRPLGVPPLLSPDLVAPTHGPGAPAVTLEQLAPCPPSQQTWSVPRARARAPRAAPAPRALKSLRAHRSRSLCADPDVCARARFLRMEHTAEGERDTPVPFALPAPALPAWVRPAPRLVQ